MSSILEKRIEEAIRVAGLLFSRGKAAGSTGNISFKYNDSIYISASGTCFGWLTDMDFAEIDGKGTLISKRQPSKEYPLHQMIYEARPQIRAVIHTHSFYTTLWSCMCDENSQNVFSDITPYLQMKVGTIGMIPKAPPGSKELFDKMRERVLDSDGYLLANHGPVIGGKDIETAFFGIEEIEETARIHYYLEIMKNKNR